MPDRPLLPIADVEMLLADVTAELAWPSLPDSVSAARNRLAAGERARHRSPQLPRRLAWAAVALAAVVVAVLALPGPRDAVADFFGLGGVTVRQEPTTVPVTAATTLDLGERVDLDDLAGVSFDVYLPAGLGRPEAFLDTVDGRQVVSIVYPPGPGLPATDGTGVGLLMSEFAGTVEPYVSKIVASSQAERFAIDGRPALWIEGPHTIFFDDGDTTVEASEPRLAANTLVVTRGGTTVRLEGAFDRATAVELAASLERVG